MHALNCHRKKRCSIQLVSCAPDPHCSVVPVTFYSTAEIYQSVDMKPDSSDPIFGLGPGASGRGVGRFVRDAILGVVLS